MTTTHLSLALVLLSAFTVPPLHAQMTRPTPVGDSTDVAVRPMNWLDTQNMRQLGSSAPSPDGQWLLYTLSVPDWKAARRQNDIYLVSMQKGLPSTRRLTFTADKNETAPAWSRDGQFFVFLSDREPARDSAVRVSTLPTSGPGAPYFPPAVGGGVGGPAYQLYLMRPDGGEARKLTDAREGGVSTFAFSKDGKWLVYRSGPPSQEQLYAMPVASLLSGDSVRAAQVSRHPSGVGLWRFAPDSRRIYFVTADTVDPDAKVRLEKRFDVRIRNMDAPLSSLWAIDLDSRRTTRLTNDTTYSVGDFTISDDGRFIGFRGLSPNRYERNILEQWNSADLYQMDVASGQIERLTNNREIQESGVSYSPDGRYVAFSAPDDFTFKHNQRVYIRERAARGGQFKKLGGAFDGDVTVAFWSGDGRSIYFNEGIKATEQLFALDVAANTVRQLTMDPAVTRVSQDEETDRLIVTRSDPRMPPALFAVASPRDLENRSAWVQLTDANSWTRQRALGDQEEISWTSADGRAVGGVLVKPVGYKPGRRYPLIVSIHGGPAAADVLGFNGGYGSQVYAGAGYAVLMPNYRNSTNYGQRFANESQGDYFTKGYQDIMAGVDHLIAQGLVDSTQMGVLGWSAGGHWSNWILTHTNRFKAISSGAGVFNWISMYGESDTQRIRQWYLGDKMYWDDMESWWRQSPAAYIKNAKTPTLIHVVDGDPRVPRPQSEELHMALKKLGVPTELFVYPGATHGIPDPRNQLLKSTAEMSWMDYWVRHSGKKFAWRDVLSTLDDPTPGAPPTAPVP